MPLFTPKKVWFVKIKLECDTFVHAKTKAEAIERAKKIAKGHEMQVVSIREQNK